MKINFFKPKKNFSKTKLSFNLNFYWKLIICLVFVISLISFFFGYYLFLQTENEPILTTENTKGQQIVKKEKLDKALEYFSAREKKSAEILNSPAPVIDPSI